MENNNLGQVKISNEVIVTIAGLAALEVENVETITTITDKLLKNNGVKIQIDEEQIILDIYVNIEFGESIPDTAFKIQENVKNTVETMTGLEVSIVNVQVQGITFYKEKAEKENRIGRFPSAHSGNDSRRNGETGILFVVLFLFLYIFFLLYSSHWGFMVNPPMVHLIQTLPPWLQRY